MTSGQFRWALVVLVVSGFLGGAACNLMTRSGPVVAQATSSQVQEEIRAKRFVLVDEAGATRAVLGFNDRGNPGLVLRDAAGKTRAGLALQPDGTPGLALKDAAGKTRAALGLLAADSSPGLVLGDAADKTRAGLGLDADGNPSLDLYDAAGKPLWSAPPK